MTFVREKQHLLSLLPLFITPHNPDTACDYLSRRSLLGQQHSNANYTIADHLHAHFRLYDHLELYNDNKQLKWNKKPVSRIGQYLAKMFGRLFSKNIYVCNMDKTG